MLEPDLKVRVKMSKCQNMTFFAKAIADQAEIELKEKAMKIRQEGAGFGRLGAKMAERIQ